MNNNDHSQEAQVEQENNLFNDRNTGLTEYIRGLAPGAVEEFPDKFERSGVYAAARRIGVKVQTRRYGNKLYIRRVE